MMVGETPPEAIMPPDLHEDEVLLQRAMYALLDARRLWPVPSRHPAAGMIIGVEEDCRATYAALGDVLKDIQLRLARGKGEL